MSHFGEDTDAGEPRRVLMHHATLRAMIDGNYDWSTK